MRSIETKLTAEALVVIPKAVRERLKVGPGDAIVFEDRDGTIVVRAARDAKDDPFAAFDEWLGDADAKAYADF